MDSKNYTNLDPKLREAYERVMNTTISPANAPSQQPTVAPSPRPLPSQTSPQIPKPAAVNETPVMLPMPSASLPTNSPVIQKQPPSTVANIVTTSMPQHNSGILPIVIILGAIIFFAVYAVFWLKFFQIQLPFLPF